MKIGIPETRYRPFYGPDELYVKMKEHGFDCADHQGFLNTDTDFFRAPEAEFMRRIEAERRRARDAGIEFWQTHGPWRYPPRESTEEQRRIRLEEYKKAIRGTAALGAPHIVLHCIMPFGAEENPEPERFYELNAEFFSALLPVAHDCGVTLCLENLPMTKLSLSTPDEVLGFVNELNDEHLKICLDTGHAAVFGIQPADALRELGRGMVRTLHVHDNDGRSDRHDYPFTGVIDWKAFSRALHDIDYDGVVSLESTVYPRIPKEAAEMFLRGLALDARAIADGLA